MAFDISSLTIPHDIRKLFKSDRSLASALFVSCIFWMTAAIVQQAVNGFGKHQLQLEQDRHISYLVATISLGIAIGAAICGWISKGQLKWSMLRLGAGGIAICLFLMAITVGGKHMLGYFWQPGNAHAIGSLHRYVCHSTASIPTSSTTG